jgi:transcriptional regulator of arginine metabolism
LANTRSGARSSFAGTCGPPGSPPRKRRCREKGGADGAYQAPGQAQANGHHAASLLQRAVTEYLARVDRVQQLVLLRTGPGQAQILGVAIDGARLPGVVGTLAGDDTILVIARDASHAKALVKRFDALSHA